MPKLDLTTLVAGVALIAVGTLLLLDTQDVISMGITGAVSSLLTAVGAVVVASGIARTRRRASGDLPPA